MKSTILFAGIMITILVADKIDKVMSLAGVILGMSNVLLIPALCHLKLCATTKLAKSIDIGIIFLAICMFFLGPITIVGQW